MVDFRLLKKIVELTEQSDIAELRIEEGDMRIRVVKSHPAGTTQVHSIPLSAPVDQATAAMMTATHPAESGATDTQPQLPTIDAPMVGTFYRAPSPDADPYVQTGAAVSPDTVVCIVEAMKVMNEITAGQAGRIADILVENGQPVEFGQPLFTIRTA